MSKLVSIALPALAVFAAVAPASADIVTTYTDSTNDLFDNGLGNLDIQSVSWTQVDTGGGWLLNLSITTRDWADWTKFMVFVNVPGSSGLSSNPWNRPVNLNGQVATHFWGAWVDSVADSQYWSCSTSNGTWEQYGGVSQNIDVANKTLTLSLGWFPYGAAGFSFSFDVATTGGGNDPGIDHLSRSDLATSGWGSESVAGNFLQFTLVPAPGALALLGLAGLVSRRRR